MSNLFVVRHAQASFFADNYDQLSPLGERQSRLLGEYWAKRGVHFDEVVVGPCVRHAETARMVGEAYRRAGREWPAPVVHTGFDEYAAEAVLKQSLPNLIEGDSRLRRLHAEVEAATDRSEKLRAFQRVYEVVIDRWAHGELNLPEIETWGDFCQRVHRALADITRSGGRRQVAVFTSGGPVGVSMQRALETTHRATLQLAWMIRNAAFSEFLFSGERFTLSRYNAFPHLDEPELWTYR